MDEGDNGGHRGEPPGALDASRDAMGAIGWELELHDHDGRVVVVVVRPDQGRQPCPDEGGVAAAGCEESDGGQAAAAAAVRKLDVGDGVAFGQEREECYVRKDA